MGGVSESGVGIERCKSTGGGGRAGGVVVVAGGGGGGRGFGGGGGSNYELPFTPLNFSSKLLLGY